MPRESSWKTPMTVPSTRIWSYSLYWFAVYRPVSYDLEWGSPTRGNNYPLHKKKRQNSIPLQTLSRIFNRCENLEGWVFLHKSLKVWHLRSFKHTSAKRPGSQSQNSCWYYWKIPFMFNGWNLLWERSGITSETSNITLWILHGKSERDVIFVNFNLKLSRDIMFKAGSTTSFAKS